MSVVVSTSLSTCFQAANHPAARSAGRTACAQQAVGDTGTTRNPVPARELRGSIELGGLIRCWHLLSWCASSTLGRLEGHWLWQLGSVTRQHLVLRPQITPTSQITPPPCLSQRPFSPYPGLVMPDMVNARPASACLLCWDEMTGPGDVCVHCPSASRPRAVQHR